MSDCSISAMEPKQPRVCGNCKNWHSVGVIRGYCGLDETLENGCLPLHLNDDAACGDYEDIPPTLQERYEQLAQVTRKLYDAAWCAWRLKVGAEEPEISNELKDRVADSYLQVEREQLEALGVSVDDVG